MKAPLFLFFMAFLLVGCTKKSNNLADPLPTPTVQGQFIKYTIQAGKQYCDGNTYKPIELSEMKFIARFDSTAIYQAQSPENQYDINKLYGFSDNNADHHQYSARFGWRWSDKALRLFAYVYNAGVVTSKELSTVNIGSDINCSIKVTGDKYLFTVDGTATQLPRMATTEEAKGYQLYPYFGGDEVAPHQVNIWIKNLD
ncbi:MAG: hypothetical protein ACXVBF_12205 [Flavisolibacter sp.]